MSKVFSKLLMAVEVNGKVYGVELNADAYHDAIEAAAAASPDGKLQLCNMPNQQLFEVMFHQVAAKGARQ
jgi:hypothetical protein